MIGLINDATQTRNIEIGKIDILKKFSFFEIDKEHENLVLRSFNKGIRYEGVKVSVEISKPESGKLKGDKTMSGNKGGNYRKKQGKKKYHKKR